MPHYLFRLLFLSALFLGVVACSDGGIESDSATSTTSGLTETDSVPAASFVVSVIQESLDSLGYDVGPIDGIPGPESYAALASFQSDNGLESTGELDGATTIALAEASPDSEHYIVEAVQTQLAELGYYTGIIDGEYGPETEAALTRFHEAEGIDEEGVVSAATLTRLTDVYIKEILLPTQQASGYEPPEAKTGDDLLRQGDEGDQIQELQERLLTLGYRPGTADGRFGANTTSAVLAFQKHEGLQRDGVVGPQVLSQLEDPQGAGPKSTSGPGIEVDLDRQIAFIIDASGTVTTINISSGSGKDYTSPDGTSSVAYTPTGEFKVERVIDGNREAPLGSLYRPIYFKEGWAVHGAANVPAYPASHGCIRTSHYDQDFIFPLIGVNDAVSIYGTSLGEPDGGSPGF